MEKQPQLSLVKVLPPILTWQNIIHTGVCVGVLNIISLILCIMKVNFLYVLTNFLLFYVITSFLYIKFLKFINKEKEEQTEEEDYYIVSKEKIQEFIAFIISKINIVYTRIKRCEISSNYHIEIITLVSLYVVSLLGKCFSIFSLVWLGLNIIMIITFCETVLNIDFKEKSAPFIEKSKAYKNMIVGKIPKHKEE